MATAQVTTASFGVCAAKRKATGVAIACISFTAWLTTASTRHTVSIHQHLAIRANNVNTLPCLCLLAHRAILAVVAIQNLAIRANNVNTLACLCLLAHRAILAVVSTQNLAIRANNVNTLACLCLLARGAILAAAANQHLASRAIFPAKANQLI